MIALKSGLNKLLDSVMSIGGGGIPGAYGGRGKDVFALAIQKHKVLEIRYEGRVGYLRVEPYLYGRKEGGARFLLAYQLDYGVGATNAEGWITLLVADIVSACPTGDTFTGQRPRPPREGQWSIIAELPAPA